MRSRRVAGLSVTSSVPCGRRPRKARAAPAITSIARVPSTNGAPMIAPIATCTDSPSPPPLSSATTGMTDSGSAVPTAASSAPTAPAPRLSRWPSHSTAFVKPIAPPTISTKAASISRAAIHPCCPLAAAARLAGPRSRFVRFSEHGSVGAGNAGRAARAAPWRAGTRGSESCAACPRVRLLAAGRVWQQRSRALREAGSPRPASPRSPHRRHRPATSCRRAAAGSSAPASCGVRWPLAATVRSCSPPGPTAAGAPSPTPTAISSTRRSSDGRS